MIDLEITVNSLHTDAMVRDELRAMLDIGQPFRLTLGIIEELWLVDSPYLKGGRVDSVALYMARAIISPPQDMGDEEFHAALIDAINTAWRAYEIIVPDPERAKGRVSSFDLFSPEWMADTMAQACQAVPSLTCHQVLWEMPFTLILHLGMSTARRNGVITERPGDVKDALAQFREMRRRHNA